MLKKVTAYCLCIILTLPNLSHAEFDKPHPVESFDKQSLYQQYPNAKVLQVATEDYPQLAEQLRSQGYHPTEPVADNPDYPAQVKKSSNCDDIDTSASEESIHVMLDVSSDLMNGASGGNGNDAAVLFVIVGTVLIVVWTLYVFKYFYDVATGFRPCGYWSQFTLASSQISSRTNEYADFNGLNYMTGFRDGATEVGISIEMGQADVLLPGLLNQRLRGRYWFLGPVLRWRMSNTTNPHYFSMNFLAGSTEHDEMGTIAKASLGLQFGMGDSAHLGFSWGAMNIDLKDNQGILQNHEEYYYLYGINFGFGF